MIKSLATLLFGKNPLDKSSAFRKLFPDLFQWISNAEYSRRLSEFIDHRDIQIGIAGEDLKRGDAVRVDLDAEPDQKVFKAVHTGTTQEIADSILSKKYPDFAVAKAKYDQARRNGKKSSHFKAEMDAIRAKDAAGE